MKITQQMIDAIPEKVWLCTQGVNHGVYDGYWCHEDDIFYCAKPLSIWHEDDEKVHRHEPGFYCHHCLSESYDHNGIPLSKFLLSDDMYLSLKLPQFTYVCPRCADEDFWDMVGEVELVWCTKGLDPGFYCYDCGHNYLNQEFGPKLTQVIAERITR